MNRFLSLIVVAGVAFLLGHFLWPPIPHAGAAGGAGDRGAQEGEYFACADSNGDGLVNIADPVLTLRFLFSDAPEPRCEAMPRAGLPATGQTKCYDDGDLTADEVPCDSPDFPGQDGFYQAGCPAVGRFLDNGDGTVTDNCTGLMWQKKTADLDGDGLRDEMKWQDASKYCESLTLAGKDDWRLPNVRELHTLADYGRLSPSIDPIFDQLSSFYWSSTFVAAHPALGWIVDFNGGYVGDYPRVMRGCVRAVHTIQPGE